MIHMALSVDADRFDDRYLRKHLLPFVKLGGRVLDVVRISFVCTHCNGTGKAHYPMRTTPPKRRVVGGDDSVGFVVGSSLGVGRSEP